MNVSHFYDVAPNRSHHPLPLAEDLIPAGFPSPAEGLLSGSMNGSMDLNSLMIQRPSSTFFVRVTGDSMRGAGIYPGDLLVIDRAEPPQHGSIILAVLDGQFTVKRWQNINGKRSLHASNPDYQPIDLDSDEREFIIWGVVTHSIRSHSISA